MGPQFVRKYQEKTKVHIYSCLDCLPVKNKGLVNNGKIKGFYTQSNEKHQSIIDLRVHTKCRSFISL
jgi:hypothetical protein